MTLSGTAARSSKETKVRFGLRRASRRLRSASLNSVWRNCLRLVDRKSRVPPAEERWVMSISKGVKTQPNSTRRPVSSSAPLLTLDEAAALLAVSRRTVQARIAEGLLAAVVFSARCVRIRPSDLDAYVTSCVRGIPRTRRE